MWAMSPKFKKIILITLGIIVAIGISITIFFTAFIYILGGGKMSTSKDQAMIDHFYQHQADFDTLVTMSNQDEKVTRIAKSFTRLENSAAWPRPESELGFPKERWDEYRRLFKEIDSDTGINRQKDGSVYITTYAFGLVTGGDQKGYAYLPNTPKNLVSSIDDSESSAESNIPIYRHITDNWYLFFSWDD